MKVAVVGGSGYVGGELLRLLLHHPGVELVQTTSDSMAGEPVARAHPNLRRATDLVFTPHAKLQPADATFVATPHGGAHAVVPSVLETGGWVFDLTADHRLKDPAEYPRYYGQEHPHPELLPKAVYGIPEMHREEIRSASLVAVPGCVATAAILALRPLVSSGLAGSSPVVVDAKSGSSAGGRDAGPAGQHAERSGVMRAYAPTGHRHTAEIEQECGVRVALTSHGVEAVRGVLATVHVFPPRATEEKELWRAYRAAYGSEPFVRVVHETTGYFREPEPKLLAGTNFCDVGFATDASTPRIVAMGALDNLGKGAAGAAVQCLNVRAGLPETAGLEFLGLHPV
ncbi:MAG TPA: N-acetyl-gamma-glutamyl-phosphate reductase [Thermoplasmata archaeon]|nr:N-acetyl-gamma-glutamyl-phosphate reductase [Thermoplasmata archaeon]